VNSDKLLFPVLFLALLIAGCAGNAARQDSGPPAGVSAVEQSVSTQTATTDMSKRAKVHTELGLMYLKDNRADVALDEAKIALEAESSYAPAYNLRGLIYMALRQNDLAESNFQQALRVGLGKLVQHGRR